MRNKPRAAASPGPSDGVDTCKPQRVLVALAQPRVTDERNGSGIEPMLHQPFARRGDLGTEQQTRKVIADAGRRKRAGQGERSRREQVVTQRGTVTQARTLHRARAHRDPNHW